MLLSEKKGYEFESQKKDEEKMIKSISNEEVVDEEFNFDISILDSSFSYGEPRI